jgi:hypothetical protein
VLVFNSLAFRFPVSFGSVVGVSVIVRSGWGWVWVVVIGFGVVRVRFVLVVAVVTVTVVHRVLMVVGHVRWVDSVTGRVVLVVRIEGFLRASKRMVSSRIRSRSLGMALALCSEDRWGGSCGNKLTIPAVVLILVNGSVNGSGLNPIAFVWCGVRAL